MNRKFFRDFAAGFQVGLAAATRDAAMSDGILQKLSVTIICHGDTLASTDEQGEADTVQLAELGTTYTLDASQLVSGSASAFRTAVREARTKLRQTLGKAFFARAADAADRAGNCIAVPSEALMKDAFLKMLEKMEVSFDKDGKPVLPQLVVHPDREGDLRRLLEDKAVMWHVENIMWQKTLKRYSL